ncbi:MAG TPA: phosphoadenylyl-sulfate reductase [Bacteroidia bacterium]|nr:phosphoadenylyl-sulfate reductase [Bacteroidia bacterium]HNT80225.1 phosphoadenylyl-sulfate reductase [Bacteroidia bacterium]
MDLNLLNAQFKKLTVEERILQVIIDYENILFTSSFGVSSIFLLYHISKIKPDQQIYFLDTGFHFKETLEYKDEVTRLLNLNICTVSAKETKRKITVEKELWSNDPDLCCFLNKVEPFQVIKSQYQIWMSGLMHTQNRFRSNLNILEQRDQHIKFYPIIDFSEKIVLDKIQELNLPMHPLFDKGFHSIGCSPCTQKGVNREGRWYERDKEECGLHN